MKRILLGFIGFMLIVACGTNNNGGTNGFIKNTRVISRNAIETGYQTVIIEGCEYIYYSENRGYSGYGFMSHKGNCKNPIHQYKVEEKINIDSVKAELLKEYRLKLSPEQRKFESLVRDAEVEMIKAQVQMEKAKAKKDSIEMVYKIKIVN